jgi:hypothetical protein
MSIETSNINPTFQELVEYLKVLGEGYVKPDLAKENRVPYGTVRETKKYFTFIDAINIEMCRRAGITIAPETINRRELD